MGVDEFLVFVTIEVLQHALPRLILNQVVFLDVDVGLVDQQLEQPLAFCGFQRVFVYLHDRLEDSGFLVFFGVVSLVHIQFDDLRVLVLKRRLENLQARVCVLELLSEQLCLYQVDTRLVFEFQG